MKYRAKKHNIIYTKRDQPYLVLDWEVVELVVEHGDKAVIRIDGGVMYADKEEFHENYEVIPERIA